ncbi:Piso0_004573 [Millerozyma farinosa CBS 7064]|uniref:Piso0_004573 protein n=1 Tax=Pichia sorbitophila (strain ATCC MYA-4447 / BCRC 22081 / CBS 7064 / NBRC 10061 / NRRL Y-12695) TaxID=559304 RepID=G8Y5U6_PICSO|nr:Piso0_004573 [Millerozyma farinosa CBS 7064]CCE85007.1 Piso0_004573 [Millerozyma farinosa CBS 7064]
MPTKATRPHVRSSGGVFLLNMATTHSATASSSPSLGPGKVVIIFLGILSTSLHQVTSRGLRSYAYSCGTLTLAGMAEKTSLRQQSWTKGRRQQRLTLTYVPISRGSL